MPDSSDFKSLLSAAVGGDRQATQRLLMRHAAPLRRRIGLRLPKSLHSVVDVDDVLQEVYVQVVLDIADCRAASAEAFAAWLNGVADHRVQEMARALQCQKRGGLMRRVRLGGREAESSCGSGLRLLPDRGGTPGSSAARIEAATAIRDALDELPSDQREVVRLYMLRGKSLRETARAVQRTPAAVRGLVHRAKKRLRELMHSSSRWFDKK